MPDWDLSRYIGLTGAVLGAIAVIHTLGGMLAVVVAATLFDAYLRRIEARQMRVQAVKARERAEKR